MKKTRAFLKWAGGKYSLVEEIAERLGYGEVSNFTHAFKRWKGLAPRQYRRRHATS